MTVRVQALESLHALFLKHGFKDVHLEKSQVPEQTPYLQGIQADWINHDGIQKRKLGNTALERNVLELIAQLKRGHPELVVFNRPIGARRHQITVGHRDQRVVTDRIFNDARKALGVGSTA